MQKNINPEAQKKRKKEAVQSAVISTVYIALTAVVLLVLRGMYLQNTFWGAVLLIIALADIGAIAPIWILLKNRLKEIEGGEEDVASQY